MSTQPNPCAPMNLAARVYLSLLFAGNYPDQEPAWQAAKNRHLLWFLVPIIGFLLFILCIEDKWQRAES